MEIEIYQAVKKGNMDDSDESCLDRRIVRGTPVCPMHMQQALVEQAFRIE